MDTINKGNPSWADLVGVLTNPEPIKRGTLTERNFSVVSRVKTTHGNGVPSLSTLDPVEAEAQFILDAQDLPKDDGMIQRVSESRSENSRFSNEAFVHARNIVALGKTERPTKRKLTVVPKRSIPKPEPSKLEIVLSKFTKKYFVCAKDARSHSLVWRALQKEGLDTFSIGETLEWDDVEWNALYNISGRTLFTLWCEARRNFSSFTVFKRKNGSLEVYFRYPKTNEVREEETNHVLYLKHAEN